MIIELKWYIQGDRDSVNKIEKTLQDYEIYSEEQAPAYFRFNTTKFPSSYDTADPQNFEDLLVSVRVNGSVHLNPLMNDKLWDIKIDENEMPCLEIYHQSSATTSGKANGIEIIIDLGSY